MSHLTHEQRILMVLESSAATLLDILDELRSQHPLAPLVDIPPRPVAPKPMEMFVGKPRGKK
jgi:hypothetical protein